MKLRTICVNKSEKNETAFLHILPNITKETNWVWWNWKEIVYYEMVVWEVQCINQISRIFQQIFREELIKLKGILYYKFFFHYDMIFNKRVFFWKLQRMKQMLWILQRYLFDIFRNILMMLEQIYAQKTPRSIVML